MKNEITISRYKICNLNAKKYKSKYVYMRDIKNNIIISHDIFLYMIIFT